MCRAAALEGRGLASKPPADSLLGASLKKRTTHHQDVRPGDMMARPCWSLPARQIKGSMGAARLTHERGTQQATQAGQFGSRKGGPNAARWRDRYKVSTQVLRRTAARRPSMQTWLADETHTHEDGGTPACDHSGVTDHIPDKAPDLSCSANRKRLWHGGLLSALKSPELPASRPVGPAP